MAPFVVSDWLIGNACVLDLAILAQLYLIHY